MLLSIANSVFAFSPTTEITKATIGQIAPKAEIQTERTPAGAISFNVRFLPSRVEAGKPAANLVLTVDGEELATIVLAEPPAIGQEGGAEELFTARFALSPKLAKGSKLHISYGVLDSKGATTSSYDNYEVLLGTFIPPRTE